MIKRDEIYVKGRFFVDNYSDLSVYIKRLKLGGNDEYYSHAIDPIEYKDIRTYEETNIPLTQSIN